MRPVLSNQFFLKFKVTSLSKTFSRLCLGFGKDLPFWSSRTCREFLVVALSNLFIFNIFLFLKSLDCKTLVDCQTYIALLPTSKHHGTRVESNAIIDFSAVLHYRLGQVWPVRCRWAHEDWLPTINFIDLLDVEVPQTDYFRKPRLKNGSFSWG